MVCFNVEAGTVNLSSLARVSVNLEAGLAVIVFVVLDPFQIGASLNTSTVLLLLL